MSMDVLTLLKYRGPLQIPSLGSLPVGVTFPALCSVGGVLYENRFIDNSWHWNPISEQSAAFIRSVIDSHLGNLNATEVNGLRDLLSFGLDQDMVDVLAMFTPEDHVGLRNLLALELTQELINRLKQLNDTDVNRLKQLNDTDVSRLKQLNDDDITRLKQLNDQDISNLKNINQLIQSAVEGLGNNTSGPGIPLGGSPANITLLNSPTTLDWLDVPGATSYDVYLNGNKIATDITDNQANITTSLADGNYHWYVIAKDSSGETLSPTWEFNVNGESGGNDTVTAPYGGTPNGVTVNVNSVELDWVAGDNNSTYDVFVNGIKIVTDGLVSNHNVTSLADGVYNWYVVGKHNGSTATSDTWTFTVDTPAVDDIIYNSGVIGVTPVPGPGEELEPDTIDLGAPDAVVVIPDDVYNNGVIGVTPVPGPGEELEPDTIDLGTPDANIVTELYPGLDVYDAGNTSGTTPIPEGAIPEPDTIDLNPAP